MDLVLKCRPSGAYFWLTHVSIDMPPLWGFIFHVPIFYTDIAPLGLIFFVDTRFYTDVAPLGLKAGNAQTPLAIRVIRDNP